MRSFDNPSLVIAHRGASAYAPENTMAAFHMAHRLGADAVELDVQLSKDGCVIIMHDDRVDRTTNGQGLIAHKTLQELAHLDAGSWFSNEFENERIPALSDLLKFAKGKLLLNIELKKSKDPQALVAAVDILLKDYGMYDECLLTSFDAKAVEAVGRLMPQVRRGLLIHKLSENIWKSAWPFVAVKWELVNEELVKTARETQKELVVWTVNDEEAMINLANLGVRRMISNYPDLLKNVMMQRKKS